ncbi:LRR receptor-like serine/threonine-protein kinase EFR [Triticum aestivum]|uniref:LRR receptor-like serine/threonine-protein kinase EFR n=1 Tax=Triticum aestivum TaxID=4565 RepID=UPI001D02C400|nr:LRR receptor-like serine/threonine-protein kinase EFR [Triticum aestivum]
MGRTEYTYGSARRMPDRKGGLTSTIQPARLTTILRLLSLMLVSCGVSSVRCSSSTMTVHDNSTDMISLLDFKRAITNDSRQVLRSWHVGAPLCKWKGVVYSGPKHPDRVIELNLTNLSLSSTISPSLGNLTFLMRLELSMNGFTGEIPPLNRLQRLEYLLLGQNSLQGTIPDTLTNYSNLYELFLSSNLLIGEVPSDIGRLSNLLLLFLGGNNLTGEIPPSLKNSSQLEYILLDYNKLTGTIPDELGKLPNLSALNLAKNRLSGGIPETLYKYNQSSLRHIFLDSNMLGKTPPSNFGDTLPNLKVLTLYENNFEGHLRASLGNISGLEWLDLSFNNFIGQVPSSFGNLGLLEHLNLQQNNLSGFIPGELGGLQHLTNLYLSDNNLQGGVP